MKNIKRSKFETSGFRTVNLSHGKITFHDGRVCRFNVRLMADPGSNGDVRLIAEDINRNNGGTKSIKLRRAV